MMLKMEKIIVSGNPYQAPNANVGDIHLQGYSDVKVFSVKGRIGRVRFLAYLGGMWILLYLALIPISFLGMYASSGTSISSSNIYSGIITLLLFGSVAVVGLIFNTMWSIQRCHDFDVSGWLASLSLIPIVNFFFFLILAIVPGTVGENRFAKQPPPNTTGIILLAFTPLFIMALGIIAAIALPAYQSYVKRAHSTQQVSPR